MACVILLLIMNALPGPTDTVAFDNLPSKLTVNNLNFYYA